MADSEKLCRLVSEFGRVCERRKLRANVGKRSDVAMGRDLDESTVAHSHTKINWPIKSGLDNDIQVGITMNV